MRPKKPTLPKLTEKQIERSILQYLYAKKIFCWKQNTVGVYNESRQCYMKPQSQFIISGVADILGCHNSKLIAIEVKTPARRKNLTDHQKHFLESINKSGGIAFVATCIEDVQNMLELS